MVYGDTTSDANTNNNNNNNNKVIPVKRKTREERAHRLFDFGSPPTVATTTTTTEKEKDPIGGSSSSSIRDSSTTIQWAAFFADCEHEILPVKSGYRITLTYRLFAESLYAHQLLQTVQESQFYIELKKLVKSAAFLEEGGRIGFRCKHSYSNEALYSANKKPLAILKGLDLVVFAAATQLDLHPELKALFTLDSSSDIYISDSLPEEIVSDWTVGCGENTEVEFIQHHFGAYPLLENPSDSSEEEEGEGEEDGKIVWLNTCRGNSFRGGIGLRYGNESTVEQFYFDAVILFKVPPFPARD